MVRKIGRIISLVVVFCMVITFTSTLSFAQKNEGISVLSKVMDVTNDIKTELDSGNIILFDLKTDSEKAIKEAIKQKADKDVVVGIGTDDIDQPASYYGIFEDEGKLVPMYVFGNNIKPDEAKKMVQDASIKFKTNNTNAKVISSNTGLNGLSTATVSDSYNLIGSAIGVYSYNNGVICYYQEYRWFTKGGNATTNFFALEKTWQAMDNSHKNSLTEYRSEWKKSGNSYQVDLNSPSPGSTTNTTAVSVSIPMGFNYSAYFNSAYDVNMTPDYANDIMTWRVYDDKLGTHWNMKNLTFVQAVYIESSVNNTRTRIDDNITTYIDPVFTISKFCYTYVQGSNSGVSW